MKVTDHDVDVERHLASPGAKSVGIGFDQHPGCVGTGPGHADAARVESAHRTEDAVSGVVGVSAHDSACAAVSQKSCQLFGVDAGVDSLPVVTTWRRVHAESSDPSGSRRRCSEGRSDRTDRDPAWARAPRVQPMAPAIAAWRSTRSRSPTGCAGVSCGAGCSPVRTYRSVLPDTKAMPGSRRELPRERPRCHGCPR